jgi:hypothetical protein
MQKLIRNKFSHTICFLTPKETVFKIFCPVVEREWVSDWDCNMVYSDSGIAEKNCIFTTKQADMPEAVWVCSIYNFAKEVEYIRTTPGYFVTVVNIKTLQTNMETKCNVTYIHTALSELGAHYITNHFTEELFINQIESWKDAGNAYLFRHLK